MDMALLSGTVSVLKNKIFRKIYLAETISLAGDAFTWVGLALVAYQIKGERSGEILSIALTLRVATYFFIAPVAGVLADRIDRKKIMFISHLGRMGAVGMLPFIKSEWQIYALVFILNVFNAIFTPAYKSALAISVGKKEFPLANSLASTTYQLLGVLGPGIAGAAAGFIGARNIFFIDAATFLIAGVIILFLPASEINAGHSEQTTEKSWGSIKKGTGYLFKDQQIRFSLLMNLASAIAGAQILINTVGYVKGELNLKDLQYGWVMSAFGIGATLAAFSTGMLRGKISAPNLILIGAFIAGIALLPAIMSGLVPLMTLWFLAGAGQTFVEVPVQNIIADRIPEEDQGKVYGAHFAWTHLWWAIAYPLAGLFNRYFNEQAFFYGGIVSLACVGAFCVWLYKKDSMSSI